ncbi:histidinol-phosphate phosphatase family domain-containing protein/HAD-superfamily hydrolase, subfamily IIIA [Quadrisphaera granulorum]|uniref:D,D-heptose 1,7-bisphosphate phosphatase n=1 Tax=Quadrisphaera granulorum TaxID=317664 RepID=A0A316AUN8_9ACTN|nr:HAD-IIIA family hydrolase [Quadrisphaera granulorum]PWJ53817.1 histidinol-phosphate phosphatase family protein/HAD superfamily hydrolase (TIGR01662 family) [Quadrisphaera granulorum]SZE96574.1 histidinol-phosphate phosphatase family domain-containing protein/HAD-superfamily hydrolase, subfamily IIIA [Quadrisphaera granulorum]
MTPGGGGPRWAVVVPSVGRPSLQVLLDSLAHQDGDGDGDSGCRPALVVVVDDRQLTDGGSGPTALRPSLALDGVELVMVRSGGRGPAAARNLGWRTAAARVDGLMWVAFVDDDVELPPAWSRELRADLAAADGDGGAGGRPVGGSQGRLLVPLPAGRRPTDWERGTAGLQHAAWATADMAYRLDALVAVGGFDERFPRAYREDADLALRVERAGWSLVRGERTAVHPVRPADDLVSLRVQRGNADDVLMAALHGPTWRRDAQAPPGRLRWHVATTAALALAGLGALAGRRRTAALGALAWVGLTADFAWRRIAPGPRDAAEVRRMVVTSAAIPVAAVRHRLAALWRWHRPGARPPAPWPAAQRDEPLAAVLFDRDGTLVHDVPYNGDPAQVRLVDGAVEALDRVRAAGLRTGLVTNQSGIARGIITRDAADAVTAEVVRQVGGLDVVMTCPHGPDRLEGACACRKPGPGMVLEAARLLGVPTSRVAVVGDIAADVGAAVAAGARGVLVPTPVTRSTEVTAARAAAASGGPVLGVTTDLTSAVDLLLGARTRPSTSGRTA